MRDPVVPLVRKLLTNILVVLVSVSAALVIVEFVVRIVRPQKYFTATVNAWDREVGTRQVPGAKGFISCPEYDIELTINSKGLRDREYPYAKPPGTGRILCLGDSYTCGYGVHADETFPKVLEDLLKSRNTTGRRWEVINAGVGSTGTAHQLAYFESEGHRYDPDLVVVCFCPANDFSDNVNSGLYSWEGGQLLKHDAPQTEARRIQRWTRWIPKSFFARSHLLNLVKYRVTLLNAKRLRARAPVPADEKAAAETYTVLTRQLLLGMQAACARRNSRLAVAMIPTPRVGDLPRWTAELIEQLKAAGIPCLDLAPCLGEQQERGVQTFYPVDGHWNKMGHDLAAHCLLDFLVEESLLPEVQPVPAKAR